MRFVKTAGIFLFTLHEKYGGKLVIVIVYTQNSYSYIYVGNKILGFQFLVLTIAHIQRLIV
jgi:hypothetical protein